MTLMTNILIPLPYSIRIPSKEIWKRIPPTIWFFQLRSYLSIYLSTQQLYNCFIPILVYIQDQFSIISPPPHFYFRPHTTLHTILLLIFYLSLHHHTTLPTWSLQHPFDFYSHCSTTTHSHHPNLLYLTSLQYNFCIISTYMYFIIHIYYMARFIFNHLSL